jgi:hypothetical protein
MSPARVSAGLQTFIAALAYRLCLPGRRPSRLALCAPAHDPFLPGSAVPADLAGRPADLPDDRLDHRLAGRLGHLAGSGSFGLAIWVLLTRAKRTSADAGRFPLVGNSVTLELADPQSRRDRTSQSKPAAIPCSVPEKPPTRGRAPGAARDRWGRSAVGKPLGDGLCGFNQTCVGEFLLVWPIDARPRGTDGTPASWEATRRAAPRLRLGCVFDRRALAGGRQRTAPRPTQAPLP